MADLLATNGILLVGESETSMGDSHDVIHVIQRCRNGVVDFVINGEVDVLETKRLSAASLFLSLGVFTGAEEPEEGDNGEVDGDLVDESPLGVVSVEVVEEGPDDGEVGWVGPFAGVVLVADGAEVRMEYGMELFVSWVLEAGIASTQVGDPLAHRQ